MSAQVSLSLQIEDVESTSLEKYEFELTITFVWSSCKLRLRSTLEILLNYKIKKNVAITEQKYKEFKEFLWWIWKDWGKPSKIGIYT